jgi:hypothetical protein
MGSFCTKVEQRTTVRHDGEKSEVRTTTTIDGKETGHTVLNFYRPIPPTPTQPPRISATPVPSTTMLPLLRVPQQQQQPFPQPPPPPYILPRPAAIPPHPQVPAVLASGVQPPPPQAVPPTANFSLGSAYVKITNPTPADIQLAASVFNQAARWSNIKYAIIGGSSAQLYGGSRPTKSLDILITPQSVGNGFLVRPVIDDLFDKCPSLLNYTGPGRHGHIVLTNGNQGVPINFINCKTNPYHFPDLIPPTRPDGTLWGHHDPEPTWVAVTIHPRNVPIGLPVPVLHPRILLMQRVLHFRRGQETDPEGRMKNDVRDIAAYLNVLQGKENVSFTNVEAHGLIARVRDVARFAQGQIYNEAADVGKWRYINIALVDEDLRG